MDLIITKQCGSNKGGDDQELHNMYRLERDSMNSNFKSFLTAVQ